MKGSRDCIVGGSSGFFSRRGDDTRSELKKPPGLVHKPNKVQLPSFFKLLRLPRRVQLCRMTAATPNIDFKAL